MKTKIMLVLVLAAVSVGGYIPIPAPVPMLDTVVFLGQNVRGDFTIDDPNGPEGLTITSTPSGLVISEPNIIAITGYPEAKRYVYNYSYRPNSAGVKIFDIKSVDSAGVEVNQQMKFTVRGNAPHVFTGCRVF